MLTCADSSTLSRHRLGLSPHERKVAASVKQPSHSHHDNNDSNSNSNSNNNDLGDWQSRAWRVSCLSPRSLTRAASPSRSHLEPAEAAEQEELSPVAKQKAKLRALEAKLASFSQDAVERITTELKSSGGGSKRAAPRRPAHTVSNAPSLQQQQHDEDEHRSSHHFDRDWPAAPLSPLRTNASYWRNGISFEQTFRAVRADHDGRVRRRSASPDHHQQKLKTPDRRLSSRFLRPEEEVELRRLRNSIGLAKDWMEQHS